MFLYFILSKIILKKIIHMCNILATLFFTFLKIKITDVDSDQSQDVWKHVTFWVYYFETLKQIIKTNID